LHYFKIERYLFLMISNAGFSSDLAHRLDPVCS